MDLPFLIYTFSRFCAILILLFGICKRKSCIGISGKSQLLYALVFVSEYYVYLFPPIDVDFLFLPIFTIPMSCIILYLIYVRFKDTYNSQQDYCKILYLIIPCALLAYCFHHFTYSRFGRNYEVLLAFSLYLESVAIVPQLLMILRSNKLDGIILSYLIILASNSGLQILYWIYDYYFEDRYYINDLVIAPSGMVQAMVYALFFSVYVRKDYESPYNINDI